MENNIPEKTRKYRWFIFIVLSTAYFFVYFHRLSFPVVANDIAREFNTTGGILGLLGSLYFYCYAFMQLPAGLLSDSIGPRKSVSSFLLIAAVGSIIFGYAPTIEVAFIGRFMVGLGVSMVFIPTMKILSQWFVTREFAMMAGILNAVGGIGVLAATWFLALMAEKLGWRVSFQIIGISTIAIAGFAWSVVRDRPQDKGWPPITEIDIKKGDAATVKENIPLLAGMRSVVSEKYFWPIAFWFFLNCGVFFSFGGLWGGPYLMHVYDMTKEESGMVLSMIAWGMILGSPFLGILSDKILKSRKKPFIICNLILVMELVFLYVFPAGMPKFVLYIWFFIFAISASAIVVVGFTMTKELFPVEIAGTSVGTVNLFPFLGGAVFMPFLGKVLDSYSKTEVGGYSTEAYTSVFLILLISSVISLICTLFMKETYK